MAVDDLRIIRAKMSKRDPLYDPDLSKAEKKPIFIARDSILGRTYDIGSFAASKWLVIALKPPDGHIYYTDSSLKCDEFFLAYRDVEVKPAKSGNTSSYCLDYCGGGIDDGTNRKI